MPCAGFILLLAVLTAGCAGLETDQLRQASGSQRGRVPASASDHEQVLKNLAAVAQILSSWPAPQSQSALALRQPDPERARESTPVVPHASRSFEEWDRMSLFLIPRSSSREAERHIRVMPPGRRPPRDSETHLQPLHPPYATYFPVVPPYPGSIRCTLDYLGGARCYNAP